jgi:site-specific DNA recombinase
VRADYLDSVVWDHITALLTDPTLIRSEINKRLDHHRTVDPATAQRRRLDIGLAQATTAIGRLIGAYQEELISLDELRTRMPELRARQSGLRHQIDALESQLADREVYLKLADNLENFLTGLRGKAATATVAERQRVLRLLVKDVLVGPDKITIRHSIPVRHNVSSGSDDSPETDSEGEIRPDCQLRWRSHRRPLRGSAISVLQGAVGPLHGGGEPPFHIQQHPRQIGVRGNRFDDQIPRDAVEKLLNIEINDPVVVPTARPAYPDRIQR